MTATRPHIQGVDIMITIDILLSMIGVVGATLVMIVSQYILSKKTTIRDSEEVKKEVDKTFEILKDTETVLDLMKKNVVEMKGYYVISKQQANKSFSSALLICFLGFIIFIIGIIISYFGEQNVIIFTTFSGIMVEIVAMLFFGLYRNSMKQLNIYHERLGTTEKYLTAIQLIEKMSKEKHDDCYRVLMEYMLIDNSSIIRQQNNHSIQNNLPL